MLIYKQIPLIISEIGAIEKTRRGQGISYAFRGIDDIYFALQPLLAKHKVFFAPNVLKHDRETRETKSGGVMTYTIITVEYVFYAEDGSHFKLVAVGEAMDTSDKSSNKAMSSALKCATLQLFCIPTEEEKDTEAQNHEPAPRAPDARISPAQANRLFAIGSKVKITPEAAKALLAGFGYASSDEIERSKYDAVVKKFEEWKPVFSAK